ncbi:MAG: hypothetical protein H6832_08140 [Planctomycetes bacterium]|nr:hypothetical protein [Planctomycetota bacterium]
MNACVLAGVCGAALASSVVAQQQSAAVRTVRFDRLVVPISPAVGERFFARATPAMEAMRSELDHRVASRRARARARLAAVDWRYLRIVESWLACQRTERDNAERLRALAWIVQQLRDRRYNGE